MVATKIKVIARKGWLSGDLKKDEDLITGFNAHPLNWGTSEPSYNFLLFGLFTSGRPTISAVKLQANLRAQTEKLEAENLQALLGEDWLLVVCVYALEEEIWSGDL